MKQRRELKAAWMLHCVRWERKWFKIRKTHSWDGEWFWLWAKRPASECPGLSVVLGCCLGLMLDSAHLAVHARVLSQTHGISGLCCDTAYVFNGEPNPSSLLGSPIARVHVWRSENAVSPVFATVAVLQLSAQRHSCCVLAASSVGTDSFRTAGRLAAWRKFSRFRLSFVNSKLRCLIY